MTKGREISRTGRCATEPGRRRRREVQQLSTDRVRSMGMARVNETKLNQFVGRMLGDMGAALSASLVLVGDRLGLYKALAESGPMTSVELAKATGTAERYVREWLAAQAASGYAEYDAITHKFSLSPEQAAVFADE